MIQESPLITSGLRSCPDPVHRAYCDPVRQLVRQLSGFEFECHPAEEADQGHLGLHEGKLVPDAHSGPLAKGEEGAARGDVVDGAGRVRGGVLQMSKGKERSIQSGYYKELV